MAQPATAFAVAAVATTTLAQSTAAVTVVAASRAEPAATQPSAGGWVGRNLLCAP